MTRPAGLQSFQTVFRVVGPKRTFQKQDNPRSAPSVKGQIITRRSHKKSRTGCQNCKDRRVKCDENQIGGCRKCRLHGIDCDYMTNRGTVEDIQNIDSPYGTDVVIEGEAQYIFSDTEASVFYSSVSPKPPSDKFQTSHILPWRRALQHFGISTCPTVTSVDGQSIFQTSVLAIASQNEYLMHAVLGTAAAHLAHLSAQPELTIARQHYRKAEAYHWNHAIKGFRADLESADNVGSHNMDALISTCMLLGIHGYSASAYDANTSFVLQPDDKRLNSLRWLSVQSGFLVVLRLNTDRIDTSIWFDMFNSTVSTDRVFLDEDEEIENIARDFQDLCGVSNGFETENSYSGALEQLLQMYRLGKPDMKEFGRYMSFMGRLVGNLEALWLYRDPAALLILAHWLTMVYQLDLWWIQDRAICECAAIHEYLKDTDDIRVQRLLKKPYEVVLSDHYGLPLSLDGSSER